MSGGYFIHFHAGGRFFFGLRLLSMGAGGCSLKITRQLSDPLQVDTPLTRMHLVHPDLPEVELKGRVAWARILPRTLEDASMEIGIEFLDPDPAFMSFMESYVLHLLKQS